MKVEKLTQIDYNTHWITCSSLGKLGVAPKDPIWLRWVKMVFQVLTLYCFDLYGHVRVDKVAKGIFAKFQKDPSRKADYLKLINKLLAVSESPINTGRKDLIEIRDKITHQEPTRS